MELLLAVVVFILLMQAIVGPILVRFTLWGNKHPRIAAIDPGSIPQPIAFKIATYTNDLKNLGFELTGLYYLSDLSPNVQGPFAMLLNAGDKTWAMIVCLKSQMIETFYTEFCTEFFDESELCTNNSTQLESFAKAYRKEVFQFPGQEDVTLLYAAHKHLVRSKFGGRSAALNGAENVPEYLEASFTKDFVKQAELGYYYLDRGGTKYRPTLKGAILMTWNLIWPISTVRKLLRRIQAQNILREVRAEGQYR